MKNQTLFRTLLVLTLVISPAVFFTSCQKTIVNQTFDDVFNTTNIQNLNAMVEKSTILNDLPEEFQLVDASTQAALQNIQISDIINSYEKNIKISSKEIDLLLQNDIDTYIEVIERISGLPSELNALNLNLSELGNTPMSKYSLIQKQEPDEYYTDDYYTAVTELQNYMKEYIIQPLRTLNTLVENSVSLKSGSTISGNDKEKEDKTKSAIIVITCKNDKDMNDAYLKDAKIKKEKKHKGSKSNNGNHYGNN